MFPPILGFDVVRCKLLNIEFMSHKKNSYREFLSHLLSIITLLHRYVCLEKYLA